MNETTHTPGPWTVERDGAVIEVAPVCRVYGHGRIPSANARVIAAAPALLASLTEMVEDWCGLSRQEMQARLARAHAALALTQPTPNPRNAVGGQAARGGARLAADLGI